MNHKFVALLGLLIAVLGCHKQVKPEAKQQNSAQQCDTNTPFMEKNVFHIYNCVQGRWEEDFEAERAAAESNARKDNLTYALTTRVLTDEEMGDVLRYGSQLFVHDGQLYQQPHIDQLYLNALSVQGQLRFIYLLPLPKKHKPKTKVPTVTCWFDEYGNQCTNMNTDEAWSFHNQVASTEPQPDSLAGQQDVFEKQWPKVFLRWREAGEVCRCTSEPPTISASCTRILTSPEGLTDCKEKMQ